MRGWSDATEYGSSPDAVANSGARLVGAGACVWMFEMAANAVAVVSAGMLRSAPSGDFVFGVRVALRRLLTSTQTKATGSSVSATAVFVDGTDVDTDVIYGAGIRYSGHNDGGCLEQAATFVTSPTWTTPSFAGSLSLAIPILDVFFVRSSTSLWVYTAQLDGLPVLLCGGAYTVGTGAGLIGVHGRQPTATTHNTVVYVLGCARLEELPS